MEHTKHLYLYDFASFTITEVYKNLPELQTLHIQNVEDFSIENFRVVAQRLLSYRGLVHLGFELTSFDLDDVKEEFDDATKLLELLFSVVVVMIPFV